jgi:hypothetical protein
MTDADRARSPWGDPASAVAAPYGYGLSNAGSMGAGPPTAARRQAPSATRRGAAAPPLAGEQPRRRLRRRPVQLVERTILVRLIPRTGIFARVRAVVALTVIAVTIGVGLAAALGVAVWGIAAAIHHAVSN